MLRFSNAGAQTVIDCGYDSQGRRYFKKVTVAGTVTLHHRYIYRGYLQIACVDCTRSGHPALWLVTWDPSQPTAARPLAIQKDGTWFTYGYDITKNICEVFGQHGYIRTAYSYVPFGAVTESGDVSQPLQWSSEVYDSELDLVYYNYRHYSPTLGRFLSRDPIQEQGGRNLYAFVKNNPILLTDSKGEASESEVSANLSVSVTTEMVVQRFSYEYRCVSETSESTQSSPSYSPGSTNGLTSSMGIFVSLLGGTVTNSSGLIFEGDNVAYNVLTTIKFSTLFSGEVGINGALGDDPRYKLSINRMIAGLVSANISSTIAQDGSASTEGGIGVSIPIQPGIPGLTTTCTASLRLDESMDASANGSINLSYSIFNGSLSLNDQGDVNFFLGVGGSIKF